MVKTLSLRLPFQIGLDSRALKAHVSRELGVDEDSLNLRLLKRSLDARKKNIVVQLELEAFVDELPPLLVAQPQVRDVSLGKRIVIVGSGPAGLFAALTLIEKGFKPIMIERGVDVQARRRDLVSITRFNVVNPDSNYCFGEGGAGTYSDGKLYTRSTKRGDVGEVLRTLVSHGATPDILFEAHPHIGTNKLPKLVSTMRDFIIACGGEVHFGERVEKLMLSEGIIKGVITSSGMEFLGEATILATGHSARDIYMMLQAQEVLIEPKPFAMGVRVEHPQALIDSIQYGTRKRDELLPASSYSVVSQESYREEGMRGVFSFCMCPGGFIVPATTEQNGIVCNGMSPSKRDSNFANSGIVMTMEAPDWRHLTKEHGVLAGLALQDELEKKMSIEADNTQKAPTQRLNDFVHGVLSKNLPVSSYIPGHTIAPLHLLLTPSLSGRLRGAFQTFGAKMKGYLTNEAIVVGVESRTSSPVRIPRLADSLQHPQINGFYPCGEGAGYAGGIVSAAMDGIRVAQAIANTVGN